MPKEFQIGDKVKFSRHFLHSISALTGDMPFAKGEILSIKDYGGNIKIATINWHNYAIPARVNTFNLVPASDVELA